jgi:hypothetical protein
MNQNEDLWRRKVKRGKCTVWGNAFLTLKESFIFNKQKKLGLFFREYKIFFNKKNQKEALY